MKYNYDYIEELKEFREYLHLSQDELANECGFEVSLIRRIEQGRKSLHDLSLRQFNRLADVFYEYDEELCKHFLGLYCFFSLRNFFTD